VTSYLFPNATYSAERLRKLVALVGKDRLVVDVSCRKRGDKWVVAMNRWQDLTDMEVNKGELFQHRKQHHAAFSKLTTCSRPLYRVAG
jgi:phosphoribosylformimino-5-aminoimidazole carboxamide ribotide isomerase